MERDRAKAAKKAARQKAKEDDADQRKAGNEGPPGLEPTDASEPTETPDSTDA